MKKAKESEIYELLNNIFKDITLCLGGIFLTFRVKDKLIWEIANSLEDIYYRAVDRLEATLGSGVMFDLKEEDKGLHPHPAIKGLLRTIIFKPRVKRGYRKDAS